MPAVLNGVPQEPLAGRSFAASLADAAAPPAPRHAVLRAVRLPRDLPPRLEGGHVPRDVAGLYSRADDPERALRARTAGSSTTWRTIRPRRATWPPPSRSGCARCRSCGGARRSATARCRCSPAPDAPLPSVRHATERTAIRAPSGRDGGAGGDRPQHQAAAAPHRRRRSRSPRAAPRACWSRRAAASAASASTSRRAAPLHLQLRRHRARPC